MDSHRDPLERMFERMRRQFEETYLPRSGEEGAGVSAMSVDVADRGDAFEVTADAPGFEKEDIDLRVSDNTLHVSARREEEREESDESYIRQERRGQSFSRSIRLPEPVRSDEASARYANGVLTVTLPKADPSARGESIDIE